MQIAHKAGLIVEIWNADVVEKFLKEKDPFGYKLWLKSK